jgi:hypothetical protein
VDIAALSILVIGMPKQPTGRRFPATPAPAVIATPTAITGAETSSVRFVRAIAARQLHHARDLLSSCPHHRAARLSRQALPAWHKCAKWPAANLAVAAQIDAALFASLARDLPTGDCRGLVMGSSNMARVLSGEANQLVRGLIDASVLGRALSGEHYQSVLGLIATVLTLIHNHGWLACAPTTARPQIG